MTWAVNVEQPGADLAALVDRVVAGEDVVLARDGRAIARVVRVRPVDDRTPEAIASSRQQFLGSMRGQFWIADTFDDPIDGLFDALKDGDAWLGDVRPHEPPR